MKKEASRTGSVAFSAVTTTRPAAVPTTAETARPRTIRPGISALRSAAIQMPAAAVTLISAVCVIGRCAP